MVCVYLVIGTCELAMYLTVYCGTVDNRIHGFDIGCEGGNLASGLDG